MIDDDFDAEMQRKIEEMIDSVMDCAQEEVDWLNATNEHIEDESIDKHVDEEHVEVISPIQVEITQPETPPLPPPRRKSTAEESARKEAAVESMPSIDENPKDESNNRPEVIGPPQIILNPEASQNQQAISEPEAVKRQENVNQTQAVQRPDVANESQDISSQLSTHLHLSSLEIDNLSVSSLHAGRIVASEIDSNTIVTNELECKNSHNLTNTQSIEFPPGFIEEIVERVRCASRAEHSQVESQQLKEAPEDSEQAPERPPLPQQFGFPEFTSAVPPSFYQLRDFSEEEVPPPVQHRRRKLPNKRKDSTSEEEYQRSRNRGGLSNDQSVMGLGGQFVRACGSALRESGSHLMEVLRASSKDEQKRDLHIALIILILIVAGLILMGMGEKSVHVHHWDFFNPPDNHGRT